MNTERFQSLHVSEDGTGHQVTVELDHGRANEMGATELDDWEALCDELEGGSARALLTFSRRHSSRGTPLFISGANVTERKGWTETQVRDHVRRQRRILRRLRVCPVFHVAVVHGVALGWGTE
ncbi:MAG: hypothetical protein QGG40_05930, partial [Myxococcota bacterium]|nr:hypothetical protein [Myxococcota bacterium]